MIEFHLVKMTVFSWGKCINFECLLTGVWQEIWYVSHQLKVPTMSATNIDTLLNAAARANNQVKEPPEEVVQDVGFLFNNLSQINLPKKASLADFVMKFWLLLEVS